MSLKDFQEVMVGIENDPATHRAFVDEYYDTQITRSLDYQFSTPEMRDEFKKNYYTSFGYGQEADEAAVEGDGAFQYVKDVASGALGTIEGMAGVAEWLSGGTFGGDFADAVKSWREDLAPSEMTFSHQVAQGVGSMLTFFIPGLGAARGASAMAKIAPRMAMWLGAGTMTTIEASTEAGMVYRDQIAKGIDEEKASSAASWTFLLNLPTLIVTNKLGLFAGKGGLARRALISGQMEGLQEAAQEGISGYAKGELADVKFKDYLNAYGVGAIIGTGAGVLSPSDTAESTDIEPDPRLPEKIDMLNVRDATEEITKPQPLELDIPTDENAVLDPESDQPLSFAYKDPLKSDSSAVDIPIIGSGEDQIAETPVELQADIDAAEISSILTTSPFLRSAEDLITLRTYDKSKGEIILPDYMRQEEHAVDIVIPSTYKSALVGIKYVRAAKAQITKNRALEDLSYIPNPKENITPEDVANDAGVNFDGQYEISPGVQAFNFTDPVNKGTKTYFNEAPTAEKLQADFAEQAKRFEEADNLNLDKDVKLPTVGKPTTVTRTPTQEFMREVIPSVPAERRALAERIAAKRTRIDVNKITEKMAKGESITAKEMQALRDSGIVSKVPEGKPDVEDMGDVMSLQNQRRPKKGVTVDFMGTQFAYDTFVNILKPYLGNLSKTSGEEVNIDMKDWVVNTLLATPRHIATHFKLIESKLNKKLINVKSFLPEEYQKLNSDELYPALIDNIKLGDEILNNIPEESKGIWRDFWQGVNQYKGFKSFGKMYTVVRDYYRNISLARENTYHKTEVFWDLKRVDRQKAGALLIQEDIMNRELTEAELAEMKISNKAKSGYKAVRAELNHIRDNVIIPEMRKSKVSDQEIADFRKRMEGYFPHRRFGNHGIIATENGETVHLEFVDGLGAKQKARGMIADIQKQFPNAEVRKINRNDIPPEALQEIPTGDFFEAILNRVGDLDADIAQNVREYFKQQKLIRGFGRHFIKRKNIPGWSTNADMVLSDYFNSAAGYNIKFDAAQDSLEALAGINPSTQSNLHKYASKYYKYVFKDKSNEFHRTKAALFYWYLGGNFKSALVNGTQNWITAAPVLSTYSKRSGYWQIVQSSKDLASGKINTNEKKALQLGHDEGFLRDIQTSEMFGTTDNFLTSELGPKLGSAMRFMFGSVEKYNRSSTFLAFFRAAKRKGLTDGKSFDVAMEAVDKTHFMYGKADRPIAGRGILSPLLTFRMFTIQYVQFLKRNLDQKNYATVAKSTGMIAALAGLTGLPGYELFNAVYGWTTGDDAEKDLRKYTNGMAKALLGEGHNKAAQKIERLVSRGLPAAMFGVDLSGSLGFGDIIPGSTPAELIGVLGDVPKRYQKIARDIRSGDNMRAVEDLAPEFIRNPMAAFRLTTQGMYTRSGSPIKDLDGNVIRMDSKQAILKAFGFQPIEMSEKWRAADVVQKKILKTTEIKGRFLDALMVAINKKDNVLYRQIIEEMQAHNASSDYEDRVIITKESIIGRMRGRRTTRQFRGFERKVRSVFEE